MLRIDLAIIPALLLAGCDDSASNGSSNSSEAVINIDRSGNDSANVSVDLPGFDANIRLPENIIDDATFDIDGVSLFPGSTVSNVRIGSADAPFKMTFDAPAAPATVVAWFEKSFAEKSVKVVATNGRITGKTEDGDAFTIDVSPAPNGHSAGTINVTDAGT